jgi:Flp pilus assembly CpaE family ATPase
VGGSPRRRLSQRLPSGELPDAQPAGADPVAARRASRLAVPGCAIGGGQPLRTSLRGLAETVIVDLGNQPSPFAPPLLREADVIVVVVEPEIIGVELTRQFLDRLRETGILSHRIRVVISNAHGSLQLSRSEVSAALKLEVAAMILHQRDEFSAASKRRLPIVIHHPQSQAMAQFKELVQALAAV